MVKNKLGVLLISIVVFALIMNVAYAAGSKLFFSDVDVKVGGKTSKNLEDGETIDDEAKPGDTVEVRVETRNNFTSEEDLKIEDISVEVTIEEIDDGDDLDEESSDFDLRPGDDKKVSLKFQVPIEVDEDTFDVTIHAEGEDENGTTHEADMRLRLEVNKESHQLKITRLALSPAEISCKRNNVQLAATAINIGNDDEQDVLIQVLNSDLGIDLKETVAELTAEPNEEESKFSKTFSFNAPPDAEAGSYPITFSAIYDDGRKKAEETATLTVNDCVTTKPETPKPEEKKSAESSDVELITGNAPAPIFQPPTPQDTVATQESFLSSGAFVVGIVIAEVVIVIAGIILVVSLLGRRRSTA